MCFLCFSVRFFSVHFLFKVIGCAFGSIVWFIIGFITLVWLKLTSLKNVWFLEVKITFSWIYGNLNTGFDVIIEGLVKTGFVKLSWD